MTAVLTVIYHESDEHYNMAKQAWKSFPEDSEIMAVVNRKMDKEYPSNIKYLYNTENCLSKAWNMGLRDLFKRHDYVVVSGLDSIAPVESEINQMITYLQTNPKIGLVSATPRGSYERIHSLARTFDVEHGDGSFSFFILSKEAFETVGKFDENFKPAYFEDDDYLVRLRNAGYTPKRLQHVQYFHVRQGTVKHGNDIQKAYTDFMARNLEYYRKKWGHTPPHLPPNIEFRQA